MDTPAIKLIHEWTVTIEREVNETTQEIVNGSPATVTRPVKKAVDTRMALKQPTRRELRAAELFYGKQYNDFVKMGFLPRSILVNKHLDISGGVLSQKEKEEAEKLIEKHATLEKDFKSAGPERKAKIELEMVAIRRRVNEINAANEAVFSQTAESKARSQLNAWFAYFMVLTHRDGKWTPYFEGDTFEQREEFLWKMEESNDPFYTAASPSIASYIGFFNLGASTPEQFAAFDSEMKRQEDERKTEEAQAKAEEEAEKVSAAPAAEPAAPSLAVSESPAPPAATAPAA